MDSSYSPPHGRSSPDAIADLRERFLGERVMAACIEAMPELVLVLNHHRQVVAVNNSLLQSLGVNDPTLLIGSRPGEILHCAHVHEGPDGCGTGPHCQVCGTALAIDECRRMGTRRVQECLLSIAGGSGSANALELEVVTAPLTIEGIPLILCAMRDISDRKRREALERLFFHDVMNTAEGLVFLSELMQRQGGAKPERIEQLSRTVWRLVDEVRGQRTLTRAEQGELTPEASDIDVPALLRDLAGIHAPHAATRNSSLELLPCPTLALFSDPVLVRRILSNLVKNAIEATTGGTVTILAEAAEDGVRFTIRNPAVMSDEVREQLFHRSFSTKGVGRGLGTYGARLIGEGFLGGRVAVTSAAPTGTAVTLWLPTRLPALV